MHVAFALEYSLGHVTHAENLRRFLESDPSVSPSFVELPFNGMPGRWAGLPVVRSNWSIRASLGAYLGLRPLASTLDAVFFHTQVTSLFCAGIMRRVPSVISLDATPAQYDALGETYGHVPSSHRWLESLKKRLNIRAFAAARHIVTWSGWTKHSLVSDYRVPPRKITVIPPGIDTSRWHFPQRNRRPGQPVHLLFVGGDFERKGGRSLIEAMKTLPPSVNAHLDIVTRSEDVGGSAPNITIYRDMMPNSDALLRLFEQADLFVFPTRGDCMPLAVMEAMAACLPVITTNVGALSEAVTDGETGLVVPVDDAVRLSEAIASLATNTDLRERMGRSARKTAIARFNAETNYGRLIRVITKAACGGYT